MRTGIIIAAFAAILASPVQAQQIFKCVENGKTVFSEWPCGDTARELDVRPSRGGYDPGAAARIRSQTEGLNRRFDAEDRARQRASEATSQRIEADRQAKIDKCRKIREERDDAKYWAGEFEHKDNIRREEAKAKSAQDALWWECREVR